ncbi:MAG: D-lyxose/D-mannose family sugar isomerase [Anaerolineae bacterium]|nr:D-lyxose/D-mannose family sugar isomerase [Anaerolineae bacterium]
MKRSEINAIVRAADAFIRERGFYLPPFAYWTPEEWTTRGEEVREIVDNGLGWDITMPSSSRRGSRATASMPPWHISAASPPRSLSLPACAHICTAEDGNRRANLLRFQATGNGLTGEGNACIGRGVQIRVGWWGLWGRLPAGR